MQVLPVFLAAKAAIKPFNADFYAATATIIPVFMLAFTVGVLRSAGLLGLAKWVEGAKRFTWRYLVRLAIVTTPAVLPLTFAVVGEACALTALVTRHNQTHGGDPLIVGDILALAIVILIGSVNAISSAMADASGPNRASSEAGNEAPPDR